MIDISIVIPTMNRALLLEQCLAALTRETSGASSVEIIVIDDGSTGTAAENNRTVCSRHNTIYCKHDRNSGMAVARNNGSALAKGIWVVFLDDDVTVDEGWYCRLVDALHRLPAEAVGFEGRVGASGSGVWDREVSNLRGGAFLTCHLGIKKNVFEHCGGFDPAFALKGPFCEDHELAARALQWGTMPFIAALSVTHAPRGIRLPRYLLTAPKRCRGLLLAEHYFFNKHPDHYHLFRSHRTFWGTLRSVMLRNVVNDLRRRSPITLLRHPLQATVLVLGSCIEQLTAWLLLPRFLFSPLPPQSTFGSSIAISRTTALWGLPEKDICLLRVNRRIAAALLFPLLHRPVYDIRPMLRRLRPFAAAKEPALYFRIDDLFLHDEVNVRTLCDLFRRHNCPFLAAITGDDLRNPAYRSTIELVRKSGGAIGLHGFSHTGKYGPYPSELLQMRIPDILANIDAVRQTGFVTAPEPAVFVPPFNAIGPGQIVYLAKYFAVICGGPETTRFTDRFTGPVALDGGGWYFPSLHPFYGSAATIMKAGAVAQLPSLRGTVCMTTHFPCEAADSFNNLSRLLASLPFSTQPWNGLF